MRSFWIIFFLFILASCAKSPEEETLEAIDVAQTYLSDRDCEKAINILEKSGRRMGDPVYVQVLASAYACRSGFSTIDFIDVDIPNINTSSTGLMRSLSILSQSEETVSDSQKYSDLRTALEILLASGGGSQPSQAARTQTFGSRKAGDIGLQIILLTVVQFGKFLNNYGNVGATGIKGAGSNTNSCIMDYTYANAQAAITLVGTDACSVFNDGHPDLSLAPANLATTKRRLCEGLILLTNLIDVLDNIDVSGNDTLEDLESVATVAKSFKTTAVSADPTLATLLNTTSQSACETTLDTASELNNMQLIYASIFESGLP